MAALENNDLADYIPQIGSFAVLTVDPVACVDYLEDPVATAACALLPSKDYVVYISGSAPLLDPRTAFREERPYFVIQGALQDIPNQFIDAGMSIPLAHQSLTHPSGRQPLKISGSPFPWSDCYLSAFVSVSVRCPNGLVVDPVLCELDEDEQFQFTILIDDDSVRRRERRAAQGEKDNVGAVDPNVDADSVTNVDIGNDDTDSDNGTEGEIDEEEAVAIFRSLFANQASERLPAVAFTHNLSQVKEFNDPKGYFQEIAVIAEIIKASLARKEAAKAIINQKDAARYDEKTTELLQAHQASRGPDAPAASIQDKASSLSGKPPLTAPLDRGARFSRVRVCIAQIKNLSLLSSSLLPSHSPYFQMATNHDLGRYIPQIGSFAVLTVDPVACVDYLEDPEATAACSLLTSKGYVVYMHGSGPLLDPQAAFREEQPYFVMQGVPRDIPDQFIEAGMSIPVTPQSLTIADHPSGRQPLEISGALFPWLDCYLTAFTQVSVRCANVLIVDPTVCELDRTERFRFMCLIDDDAERRDDLRADAEEAKALTQNPTELATATDDIVTDTDYGDSGDAVEEIDEQEAVAMAIFRGLFADQALEHLPAVKFTHDLSQVKEFNDPKGYFQELAVIAEIIKASLARKEAAKDLIIQKDAARYDEKTAELLRAHQASHAPVASQNSGLSFAEKPAPTAPLDRGATFSRVRVCIAQIKHVFRRIMCQPIDHNT
ncbi:hypothetical protein MIND_01305600 [Mycena indigotica]|uniref:Uncharacterized protein n=1 Tax=Mycena indigotica TaxID=2126181 RepID=A0A8H6S108_9AGAR|nr:uncharacterized protein MIND_01305600 [Mycena indigotica]KAF7290653.1 hypothetical protein MIND_01305600 [Mycena indigotica]